MYAKLCVHFIHQRYLGKKHKKPTKIYFQYYSVHVAKIQEILPKAMVKNIPQI